MQRKEHNDIQWLTFDLLSDISNVIHGSFLRHGGYSQGPYSSLNLATETCQSIDPEIEHNLNCAKRSLNLKNLRWAKQCHGTEIVTAGTRQPEITPSGDALVTYKTGIGLMIKHADCQAALFLDPIKRIIAGAHSGWRGSVGNIYGKLIDHLKIAYHCNPADLLVCIGPSLGPLHAEFVNYRTELPVSFWDFQIRPNYFDFWAISENQLKNAGILPHHIEIARMCTYANTSDCFSARRDRITGRHGTIISLL